MTVQTTAKRQNHVNIMINRSHYKLDQDTITGAQLLALAGIPDGNQLFEDVPGHGDDLPIAPGQDIKLRNGMKFYDVPVGNLG